MSTQAINTNTDLQPARYRTKVGRKFNSYVFILLHFLPLLSIWTGVTLEAALWCVFLIAVRMFGVTAGYHRYFAHKTFKTSRVMQFLLAFLAQTSAQKGVLWWASHHRDHHRYSDTEKDVHSPVQKGFWYSHVSWIWDDENIEPRMSKIRDFARYPELRFIDRHWWLPPWSLGVLSYLLFDWSGLFFGFMLSTVILWHLTFLINSLTHMVGHRDYETTDGSRNSFWIALLTFGEGWHNNHHYYMYSTRQGFRWWQIDITYYVLKLMSWVGLVWDLKEPPREVVEAAGRSVSEQAIKGTSLYQARKRDEREDDEHQSSRDPLAAPETAMAFKARKPSSKATA